MAYGKKKSGKKNNLSAVALGKKMQNRKKSRKAQMDKIFGKKKK